LIEAPAALASAGVGILMEPLNEAGNLLTDAASSTGLADPALSFSYVSGDREGEEDSGAETEQSAFVKTASMHDGAQVDVDTAAGKVAVEFLNPEKRYLVLIIPSSSSDPILAAEAERTPYETLRAEFTNVPAVPCVLAVYVLPESERLRAGKPRLSTQAAVKGGLLRDNNILDPPGIRRQAPEVVVDVRRILHHRPGVAAMSHYDVGFRSTNGHDMRSMIRDES
jgi:hypothetical protein